MHAGGAAGPARAEIPWLASGRPVQYRRDRSGRRPSVAALTRSGARMASEIVMIDLADAAFFARGDLFDISHSARSGFIQPAPATGD